MLTSCGLFALNSTATALEGEHLVRSSIVKHAMLGSMIIRRRCFSPDILPCPRRHGANPFRRETLLYAYCIDTLWQTKVFDGGVERVYGALLAFDGAILRFSANESVNLTLIAAARKLSASQSIDLRLGPKANAKPLSADKPYKAP